MAFPYERGTPVNQVGEIPSLCRDSEFFIDNLLVRIHFIIVMIRWTGLAAWEIELRFPSRWARSRHCARRASTAPSPTTPSAPRLRERHFFIDNLLVRIHFIVMIWWTGLAVAPPFIKPRVFAFRCEVQDLGFGGEEDHTIPTQVPSALGFRFSNLGV